MSSLRYFLLLHPVHGMEGMTNWDGDKRKAHIRLSPGRLSQQKRVKDSRGVVEQSASCAGSVLSGKPPVPALVLTHFWICRWLGESSRDFSHQQRPMTTVFPIRERGISTNMYNKPTAMET
jgi:hypothetical protein